MKYKATIILLLLFGCLTSTVSNAQSKATTFILVRHAEKDLTQSTNDPDLALEGKERSLRLKELFKLADINAVYTTPYKRTTQTVQPLADETGLTPIIYQPMDFSVFNKIIEENPGGKVLVAGHSNTIPAIVNYLTGSEKYKVMGDGEYGKLFIVTVDAIGDASVLILNF